MSPPWGGTGYNKLEEYSLEHICPNFDEIIRKTIQYSPNLMIFLPRNTSIKELVEHLLPFAPQLQGTRRFTDLCQNVLTKQEAAFAKSEPNNGTSRCELSFEVERIMTGDSCTAICVYTGDLVHFNARQVATQFIDDHCYEGFQANLGVSGSGSNDQSKKSKHRSCLRSSRGSSISSKGTSRDSAKSNGSSQSVDYLSQVLTNVIQHTGYENLCKFVARQGKSPLSLQKVVKHMQKKFTPEDWYYLRKIHKKEHNYFLDKGGKLGSSGGGWVDISPAKAKPRKSACSSEDGCGIGSLPNEEEKSQGSKLRLHMMSATSSVAARRFSSCASSGAAGTLDYLSSHNSEMIDEERASDEEDKISENLLRLGAIQEAESSSTHSGVQMLSSTIEAANQPKDHAMIQVRSQADEQDGRGHIELKNLSEDTFLQLIDSKNQDRRFYGWLNFQPMLQEFEPDDPVVKAHQQILDAEDIMNFFSDLQNLCFEEGDDSQMQQDHTMDVRENQDAALADFQMEQCESESHWGFPQKL